MVETPFGKPHGDIPEPSSHGDKPKPDLRTLRVSVPSPTPPVSQLTAEGNQMFGVGSPQQLTGRALLKGPCTWRWRGWGEAGREQEKTRQRKTTINQPLVCNPQSPLFGALLNKSWSLVRGGHKPEGK